MTRYSGLMDPTSMGATPASREASVTATPAVAATRYRPDQFFSITVVDRRGWQWPAAVSQESSLVIMISPLLVRLSIINGSTDGGRA